MELIALARWRRQRTCLVGVYVLVNDIFPDLVKIGCTHKRHPLKRLEELNSSGLPVNWQMYYYRLYPDPYILEAAAHQQFADRRFRKEFFTVEPHEARRFIESYRA